MASLLTDEDALAMARLLRAVHVRQAATREFVEAAAAELAPDDVRQHPRGER